MGTVDVVMKLPAFPECCHPVVQSLADQSDQALLHLFRSQRDKGQYFTVIFCRYSHLVYALVRNVTRSPLQVDYLFAKIWHQIYHELILNPELGSTVGSEISLQSWILNETIGRLNRIELPPVETVNYALSAASPPLWCYLEEALAHLPAALRLMVTLAQTFHWSETRIAAYLEAEGEAISSAEVQGQLQAGYQLLETFLPQDIQAIYLNTAG